MASYFTKADNDHNGAINTLINRHTAVVAQQMLSSAMMKSSARSAGIFIMTFTALIGGICHMVIGGLPDLLRRAAERRRGKA